MSTNTANAVAEERQSLWLLIASPIIWGLHFLVSYTAAAVWCGKLASRGDPVDPVRAGIVGLGILALLGIGVTGRTGWRKHTHGETDPPYYRDTPEDRHRFLGFATVLLSFLSAIATIFVMISTLFFGDCR